MSEDSTQGPQSGPQSVLTAFKNRLFPLVEESSRDIELQSQGCKNQPSTSQSSRQLAIYVRNACKSYGTVKTVVVLDGLDMTVPTGTIYGLLGPSGCGKTTLLSCIVGRRKLNSGTVWVLGGTPGTSNSGTPGPRIGYMPQEVGLYGEFSILETFTYFGRVLGMPQRKILERYHFFVKLFMLPDTKDYVRTLSGGQQRRVSLASALLHEPELLVLDEPTVGVDPVIREIIWEYFAQIVKTGSTTIIITTHYIEEARRAHTIGLLRKGVLLAEEHPEELMLKHGAQTLEEVFLKLSTDQSRQRLSVTQGSPEKLEVSNGVVKDANNDVNQKSEHTKEEEPNKSKVTLSGRLTKVLGYLKAMKPNHMKALLWKNELWFRKNLSILIFLMSLPFVIVVVFCTYIGHEPGSTPVAVVNYEIKSNVSCNDDLLMCQGSSLSCSYLGYLQRRALDLIYYDSEEEAKQAVIKGHVYASIVVPHNYSDALRARVDDWDRSDPWDLEYSNIEVIRDVSNKLIATYLKVNLYETFQIFIEDYLESCSISRRVLTLPVKLETPVYGTLHPDFTDFTIAGLLLSMTFVLTLSMTSIIMLIERNESSLERSIVMGINGTELLLSHIITQTRIMFVQALLAMICAFWFFQMTIKGSIILTMVFMLEAGFCGMTYGLLISTVCDRQTTTMILATGSVLPILIMCGVIWPLEAIHPWLKPFAFCFPLTQAVADLRSILHKSWGLASVYPGLISMNIWTVIFLLLSIAMTRFKNV